MAFVLIALFLRIAFAYVWVYSAGHWAAGANAGSVARAFEGGPLFQGPGGLLGPVWPYFPLTPLLTALVAGCGVPLLSVPPLMGGLSALALPVGATLLARQNGSLWIPAAVVSFALFTLFLPRYVTFEIVAAGFYPDAAVAAFLIFTALGLRRLETQSAPIGSLSHVLFGALLVLAGLSKQVGTLIIAGTFIYLLLFAGVRGRRQSDLLGTTVTAGLIVIAIILFLPHCFELTVSAISRHDKDFSRIRVFWESLLGVQLAPLVMFLAVLPQILSRPDASRRQCAHLHCMLALVFALQFTSTMKDGSGGEFGSYNMEMILSVALAVSVWGCATGLSQLGPWTRTLILLGFCILGAKAGWDAQSKIWSKRDAAWPPHVAAADHLRALAPPGPVFAPDWDFAAVYLSGHHLATANATVWIYAVLDKKAEKSDWIAGIEHAIDTRSYALISPHYGALLPAPVAERLKRRVDANYRQAPGSQWLIPRESLSTQ